MNRNLSGSNPTWAGPNPSRRIKLNSGAYTSEERSQRDAAMGRDEEADLIREAGCPLGLKHRRASQTWAKPPFPLLCGSAAPTHSVGRSRMLDVLPGTMLQQWQSHFTGEVLRCLRVSPAVTHSYKNLAKGCDDASVAQGMSLPLRLQGCQQRQSTHGATLPAERQNHHRLDSSESFTGKVSSSVQATKWPGRTFSCQPGVPLRNTLNERFTGIA